MGDGVMTRNSENWCGYCATGDLLGYAPYTDPRCPEHGVKAKRSCNLHEDCDYADLMVIERTIGEHKAFHCDTEDCVDCFGD